jgi:deoxyribodipyrimidine photo-lyase
LEHRSKDSGYRAAIEGRTGIDCFDTWNAELLETNYLHNHARMWYASIWVHTLKLPWQLGADWFLRHLLDGDAASNTLGWRWIAGLHTRGKAYLARADNIRKYTNDRFAVEATLAAQPVDIEETEMPNPRKLTPPQTPPTDRMRLGLLITDDDLSALQWIRDDREIQAVAGIFNNADYEAMNISEPVVRFRRDSLSKANALKLFDQADSVIAWMEANDLEGIVTAMPISGLNEALPREIERKLDETGRRLYTLRHWWDQTLFPHATHGFFRFKKAIPKALAQL